MCQHASQDELENVFALTDVKNVHVKAVGSLQNHQLADSHDAYHHEFFNTVKPESEDENDLSMDAELHEDIAISKK